MGDRRSIAAGARAIRARIASRTSSPSGVGTMNLTRRSRSPARLEPVHDAGHVRVVAREVRGDLVHWQARLRVELHQRAGLGRVQVEVRGGVEETPALREQQLAQ